MAWRNWTTSCDRLFQTSCWPTPHQSYLAWFPQPTGCTHIWPWYSLDELDDNQAYAETTALASYPRPHRVQNLPPQVHFYRHQQSELSDKCPVQFYFWDCWYAAHLLLNLPILHFMSFVYFPLSIINSPRYTNSVICSSFNSSPSV